MKGRYAALWQLLAVVVPLVISGCAAMDNALTTGGAPAYTGATVAQAQAIPYWARPRITVAKFENKSNWRGQVELGEGIADMLATEIVKSNGFIVLERQSLGTVLAEQDLAKSGRIKAETGAPTGEIEGAELQIVGAVTDFEFRAAGGGLGINIDGHKVGGKYKQAYVGIDFRVIDTKTSRIVFAQRAEGRSGRLGLSVDTHMGDVNLKGSTFFNSPMGKATRQALTSIVNQLVMNLGSRQTPTGGWTSSMLGPRTPPAPAPAPSQ